MGVIPSTEVPPASWWDADADKSILIGTYRYGYEQFDLMRTDPHLCFLSRCGPPSSNAETANKTFDGEDGIEAMDEDSVMSSKTPSEKGNSLKPDDVLDNSLASEDVKMKKSEKEKDDADEKDSKKDEKDK